VDLLTCESLAELAELTKRSPALFVRYSRGPDRDMEKTSCDYESGLELPGLSVTPLTPASWWTRPLVDWLARQVRSYAHLKESADDDRCAWALEGAVVERGPDNEPLLADVRPIAMLSEGLLREAHECYRERFETGANSTGERARASSG
jgi:hypothetical protein